VVSGSNRRVHLSMNRCYDPGCDEMGTDYMQCPCRAVSYCSKVCQKIHWRAVFTSTCVRLEKKLTAASMSLARSAEIKGLANPHKRRMKACSGAPR
jgi:hypothetical protein